MSQRYAAVILLVSSLLNTSMAASKEMNIMINQQNDVINAVEKMTSAFHAKNINGVISSYENDATIMFEPGKAISDPDIIKQMFEGAFQINPKFTYPKGHEVFISNDIALHISPWVMNGKAPDGTDIEQSGLSVAVLRKQENGQWLLVLDNPHGQFLMDN
ncbi:DUF4440 domain-containing protein [Paraglaciecola sp.]|uniref:YybH family protein n=1 Tax=Paraglaciecola sp. TaxID=1920173 RepID=UPI0030F3DA82